MKITSFVLISFFSLHTLYAGCGSCNVSNTKAEAPSSKFATTVAKDGSVKGFVLASCGMCNFGMKGQKECSLAIKIDEMVYSVNGTKIDEHGNSHAKDGFCNAVRVADVNGKIVDGNFETESFVLTKN